MVLECTAMIDILMELYWPSPMKGHAPETLPLPVSQLFKTEPQLRPNPRTGRSLFSLSKALTCFYLTRILGGSCCLAASYIKPFPVDLGLFDENCWQKCPFVLWVDGSQWKHINMLLERTLIPDWPIEFKKCASKGFN